MTDQRVPCDMCAPPASAVRPRVLVIDDEEAIRSALSRVLAAEGLVIDLAETAADGLSRARAEVYDLVPLALGGVILPPVREAPVRRRPGSPASSTRGLPARLQRPGR